jgi:amidase
LLAGALAGDTTTAPPDAVLERTEPAALAWLPEFPWAAVSSEQRDALDAAVGVLRNAGARVTTLALPAICRDAPTQLRRIMLYEAVRELGALQDRERGKMSAKLNAALDEGRAIGDDAYADALAKRTGIMAALTGWLAGFDAVVTPPATGPAPQDLTQTGDPACCSLWSLAGFPALSLPVALAPNGLPLGMQLAAPASHDRRLLAVANWCERRLPFRGLV